VPQVWLGRDLRLPGLGVDEEKIWRQRSGGVDPRPPDSQGGAGPSGTQQPWYHRSPDQQDGVSPADYRQAWVWRAARL